MNTSGDLGNLLIRQPIVIGGGHLAFCQMDVDGPPMLARFWICQPPMIRAASAKAEYAAAIRRSE